MAIKAKGQITLSSVVDVKATYRYYLLQSSTLSKPSKPTSFPPSSTWSDTEPSYKDGSTNSLYFVDCTVFCDDTFAYSAVSLSSSYEAAKAAYNKATNAQAGVDSLDTRVTKTEASIEQNKEAISLRATKEELKGYYTKTEADAKLEVSAEAVKTEVSKTYATKQEVNDIQIGGRNLLLNSSFKDSIDEWQTVGDVLNEKKTVSGTQVVRVDDISDKAPATVQLASKNLLDDTTVWCQSGLAKNDEGQYWQTTDDTKDYCQLKVQAYNNETFVKNFVVQRVDTTGVFSATFEKDDTFNRLKFGHDGSTADIVCLFYITDLPNGTYTFSANVTNTTVNYISWEDMQIEKGSVATEYTPYVSGKNLLPYPYKETTKTLNGITFTDNGDGSITINGTSTNTSGFEFIANPTFLEVGKTYTISGAIENCTCSILFAGYKWEHNTFTMTEEHLNNSTSIVIQLQIVAGCTFNNAIVYPQLELGSTATPYTPYSETGALTGHSVTVGGKNLLPYPYAYTTKTVNGITFTDNGDGTITANGTATARAIFQLCYNIAIVEENETYTLSGCPSGGSASTYMIEADLGSKWPKDTGSGIQFAAVSNKVMIYIVLANGFTADNLVFEPQLELGTTATEYEPYKSSTYYADENGLITINTPYSPITTTMTAIAGLNLDMTYKLIGNEFSEKYGKPCLWVKHYALEKEKSLYQSVIGKLEPDTQYTLSGWLLSENVTEGLSDFGLTFHHQGTVSEEQMYELANIDDNGSDYDFKSGEGYYTVETVVPSPEYGEKCELTFTDGSTCAFWDMNGVSVDGGIKEGDVIYYDGTCIYEVIRDGGRVTFSYGSIPFEVNTSVGSWEYVSLTFTTDSRSASSLSEDIYIHTQDLIGDVYICNLKLEKGNKVTDWTPAPEDTDRDIDEVKSSVLVETRASLDVTEKSILSKVEETYVNTDSFDSYKVHASSQVTQTAHDLTVSFTSTTTDLENKLDGEIEKREKHIKMSDKDGLIISAGENSVKVVVNNDLIAFIKGSEQRKDMLENGVTIDSENAKLNQGSGIYILSEDQHVGSGRLSMTFEDGSYCALQYPSEAAAAEVEETLKPGTAFIYDENEGTFEQLGEQLLGYWNGNNFYGGNLMIRVDERAQFGNFAAIPRSNGNLSWLKVK